MKTLHDYDAVPDMMVDVASKHILPYFQKLQAGQIQRKTSPKDLVCIADLEAEKAFRKKIETSHPGLLFVGEESFYEAGGQPITTGGVNDSIDGSWYFIHGKETFCSMQNFLENSRIVYSAIYQPLTRHVAVAKHEQGVTYNGEKIEPKTAAEFIDDQITIGHFGEFTSDTMQPLLQNARNNGLSIGEHVCASIDYLRFVRGEIDNIVYKNAYPWDVAAGALIYKEMGGHAALLHSEKDLTTNLFYDINQPVLMTRRKDDWCAVKGALLT